jgi:hypothetical protein
MCLKQYDVLSPFICNCTLEYTIKVQEKEMGLKLNGAHQLLVYDHDVNLLGEILNTLQENNGSVLDNSKISVKVNTEITKSMLMVCW